MREFHTPNGSYDPKMDVAYVDHITFLGDVKIILDTVMKAFIKQEGISSDTSVTMEEFKGN